MYTTWDFKMCHNRWYADFKSVHNIVLTEEAPTEGIFGHKHKNNEPS